jgi:predicted alpha/beta hydrolase family esterase
MKKQVFYIHGGESYEEYSDFLERLNTREIRDLPSAVPYVKWTKSMAEDLGEDYEVFLPQMPNSQNAKYEEWKIWFERHFEHLHKDVILMGCSLGAMFLYRYLIENKPHFSIKSVILMASPVPELLPKEEKDGGDFFFKLEDVYLLQQRCNMLVIMHSKDDFLVPYEHALKLKEALPEAELVTFEDKNHFLVSELPELIERIKEMG